MQDGESTEGLAVILGVIETAGVAHVPSASSPPQHFKPKTLTCLRNDRTEVALVRFEAMDDFLA